LIERFSNPSLKHNTWQIAMDGSQKIPQRFGGALRHHLEHGGDIKWLALGIAGWMRYVSGVDELGQDIDVRDPMAKMLKEAHTSANVVTTLLSVEAVFPKDIGQNQRVIDAVSEAYNSLITRGARACIADL
jgi:fructuronate reductase